MADPPATPSENGTEYVVLRLNPPATPTDETTWTVWDEEVQARSAETALRKAIGKDGDGGTFVAVPARSWRPVKVKAETVTTLKLEEA